MGFFGAGVGVGGVGLGSGAGLTSNCSVVPFKQMEGNRSFSDRFPTSWSVQRGHHFFLWIKVIVTISHFDVLTV